MYIWLVCGSIRRFIISFALNRSYCGSRLKNELYMYIWLVCCGSIRRLIISFALNGLCCRSPLKNELYMYIWLVCCCSIPRLILSIALNGSCCRSRLKRGTWGCSEHRSTAKKINEHRITARKVNETPSPQVCNTNFKRHDHSSTLKIIVLYLNNFPQNKHIPTLS